VVVALDNAPGSWRGAALDELHIGVLAGRGAVVVEVETRGAQTSRPSSWHWLLAERLAAVAGGTLEPLPDRAGVGIRFQ
jgi:hypothetical protein